METLLAIYNQGKKDAEEGRKKQPPSPSIMVSNPINSQTILPIQTMPNTIIIQIQKEVKIPKFSGKSEEVHTFCTTLLAKKAELKATNPSTDTNYAILSRMTEAIHTSEIGSWYSNKLLEGTVYNTVEEFIKDFKRFYSIKIDTLDKFREVQGMKQDMRESIQMFERHSTLAESCCD